MRRLAAMALLALALAGCPATHDAYPDTRNMSCVTDDDCYQGEHCGTGGMCVAGAPDMAMATIPGMADDGGAQ